MGYLTISTNVRHYQTHHGWNIFLSGRQHLGAHALCCRTAAALWTYFLLDHAPNSPSSTHWLQDLFSRSCELKRLKKSSSDWLNSGNALIQHLREKHAIFMFPGLPGSAETHVNWGGTVKHLLIASFIGNISAKKHQNAFTCVKGIANQRWDVFLRHKCTIGHAVMLPRREMWRSAPNSPTDPSR